MLAACGSGDRAGRDLAALGQVLKIMRQLLEAAAFVPASKGGDLSWLDYRRDVLQALQAAMMPAAGVLAVRKPVVRTSLGQHGPAVRFGALEAGRAVAIDTLFVLGLAEGEFPLPVAADPIYAPAEREAQIAQYNYFLVVGEKEVKNGTVTVRKRTDNKDDGKNQRYVVCMPRPSLL